MSSIRDYKSTYVMSSTAYIYLNLDFLGDEYGDVLNEMRYLPARHMYYLQAYITILMAILPPTSNYKVRLI